MIDETKNWLYKILRWSEKYTKTDMVYLAHGHFWLISGQVLASAATFLLAIAFANFLPKESYGTYKYILSIAGILTISNLSGMDGVITQAVARGYEGSFLPALKYKIKYGFFGTMVALLMSAYYFLNHNNTLGWSLIVVAATMPFMAPFIIYDGYLLAKKQFKLSSIYKTIGQIIAAIIFTAVVFLSKSAITIVAAYFLTWVLLRFIFLYKTIKKFPPNKIEDPQTISYGKHTSFINILATLVGSADSLLLFHYIGAAELAIYSFAVAPIFQMRAFLDKIPILALPKFAKRSIAEIHTSFWKRFWLLFGIGAFIAAVYILAAPWLFSLFFPQYSSSVLYSQIFSISVILVLVQSIMVPVLNSRLTVTPKKLLYLWNIPGIVMIVSMVILLKYFGITGVVISRLLSTLTAIIINFIIYYKLKKIESNTAPNLSTQ